MALGACKRVEEPVGGTTIACAVNGAAMARACTVERSPGMLIVLHADGGFRRFSVDATGGIASADGADPVQGKIGSDGLLEIAVADDRYRIPAR